jgi:predicted extracellular nuclease
MNLVPRVLVATSLILGATSLYGCRGSDDEEKEPKPDAGEPVVAESKIQDVQGTKIADGGKVKLDGVIVTAIDAYGNRTGSFYVQEPEGGELSGVLVFGAKLADVATLSVGDIVNLDGMEKDEFLPPDDATGRTLTELRAVRGGAISITKVSAGATVTPHLLDITALAAMTPAAAEAEIEKWEGVLVKVENVTQLYDLRPASSSDMTFKDFAIDAGLIVDTSLTEFAATAVGGTCYASITGMGDYFYNYKVLPRNKADMVVGENCPAGRTASIPQVQEGTYPKSGLQPNLVRIPESYVTAVATVSANFKSIWISQDPEAAAFEGVQVFMSSTAIPAGAVPGAKVSVVGTATEYDNSGSTGDKVTQIFRPIVKVTAAPDPLVPLVPLTGISLETAASLADGEPYEGVLMTFTNLKVTAHGANDAITLSDTSTPAKTIIIDDEIFDYTLDTVADNVGLDTCYSSITVIASLNTQTDTRMFLPRSVTDLVVDPSGAACLPPPPPPDLQRR